MCLLLSLKGIDPEAQMPDRLNGQIEWTGQMPSDNKTCSAFLFIPRYGKAKSLQHSGKVYDFSFTSPF